MSMVKRKRALRMMGILAAVYVTFRYLLPLVFPFFIAYGLAKWMDPAVSYVEKRVPISRKWIAFIFLIGIAIGLGGILWWLLGIAGRELPRMASRIPAWMDRMTKWGMWLAEKAEMHMQVKQGVFTAWLAQQLEEAAMRINEGLLLAAKQSFSMIKAMGNGFAVTAVIGLSTLFLTEEKQKVEAFKERCLFQKEIRILSACLGRLGRAFFRTQGVIFLINAALCTGVFWWMGHTWCFLAGILLALLDILPIFGTGTVLLPWAGICLFSGNWKQALCLLGLYLVTYGVREWLEASMMGKTLGIGSVEMMIAMYIGWKIFGIWGLFLGPIGWILIKEIDKTFDLQ